MIWGVLGLVSGILYGAILALYLADYRLAVRLPAPRNHSEAGALARIALGVIGAVILAVALIAFALALALGPAFM